MATPAIVHVVGDDWIIPIRWTAGDPAEPVDLTGYEIEGALYHAFVDAPIVLTAAIGDQAEADSKGLFEFTVPAATTATFKPDPRGTYGTSLSITMIDPAGHRRTYAKLPILADAPRFAETYQGFVPPVPPAPVTVPGSITFGATTLTVTADSEVEILTVAEQGPMGSVTSEMLELLAAAEAARDASIDARDDAQEAAEHTAQDRAAVAEDRQAADAAAATATAQAALSAAARQAAEVARDVAQAAATTAVAVSEDTDSTLMTLVAGQASLSTLLLKHLAESAP